MPTSPTRSHLNVVSIHDPGGLVARLDAEPDCVRPLFHPIADLRRGTAAGYEVVFALGGDEALAPRDWSRRMHADSAGAVEARLLQAALACRERRPGEALLAVDLSASALLSEEVTRVLAEGGSLDRLVLVVTGDSHGVPGHAVRAALEPARAAGAQIAVDQSGSGHASLRQVLSIRPELVRVGGEFVVEVDRDAAKAAVVESLVHLGSRVDARVVASGIPGWPELAALRRMGVPLGQGPMLGGPATEMRRLPSPVVNAVRAADAPPGPAQTVAPLVEARPALARGASLEELADAFLDDPRHDVVVLVDERRCPLALAERAALLRGEPYERPVMRITPSSPLKAVARRAAARPVLERFHPLVACDRRGVYLGIVRVEQLLDALAQ